MITAALLHRFRRFSISLPRISPFFPAPSPRTILKVTDICGCGDSLKVEFVYACKDAELTFTRPVKAVTCGGRPVEFTSVDGLCRLAMEVGAFEFTF